MNTGLAMFRRARRENEAGRLVTMAEMQVARDIRDALRAEYDDGAARIARLLAPMPRAPGPEAFFDPQNSHFLDAHGIAPAFINNGAG